MQLADPTLEHITFLRVLGALESDRVPEWRELSAGFVCLRLVSQWTMPQPFGARPRGAEGAGQIALARTAVEAIVASDVRSVLASLLDSLEASLGRSPLIIRPRLMAYARTLEHQARWDLAIDVYRTVLDLCDATAEWDELARAYLRLGECHRQRAEWSDAEAAFACARQQAAEAGDVEAALRARCLSATVAAERGNLPAAERELTAIERAAAVAGLRELHGLARHGRAHVAFQRRDYEAAARHAFEALADLTDLPSRNRALADVAQAFAELGVRQTARDAHLIVASTATEPYIRWTALINLMELAALDRDESTFEQYRAELAAAPLPPRLAGYFHFYAGAGAWAFGRLEMARIEYGRALAIATADRLAQLTFETEAALARLGTAAASSPAPSAAPIAEPSASTAAIAATIAQMRARSCAAVG